MAVDEYIDRVIRQGDAGSALLARLTAPTLRNSRFVDVLEGGMNGLTVLRIPEDHYVAVCSGSGNASEQNIRKHAAGVVDRLATLHHDITPLAFANVVDSSTGDIGLLTEIGEALAERANAYGLAILNGENAILGSRITQQANVSVTMVGIVEKGKMREGVFHEGTTAFAVFDPEGNPVYLNSDGVGTKTELYERAGVKAMPRALEDSLAMKLDDAAKVAATIRVVADVVETRGTVPIAALVRAARELGGRAFRYLIQHEAMDDRLMGYAPGAPAYNISGTAVSTIDEEQLRNPRVPRAGDALVALVDKPNPRSNGITSKRRIMAEVFGANWHTTPEAAPLLAYLTTPSTVLYPLFHELTGRELASGVFHMSGGAYDGKLARPLAKHGLFAAIENQFPPNWQDLFFAGARYTPAETAYAQWPMGNDGFVTTGQPAEVIAIAERHGLRARVVGMLQTAIDGRTGVELVGIKGSNGQNVYYAGK